MQHKWILPSGTIMAMAVSFALFVFMANLISKPGSIVIPPTTVKPVIEYQPKKATPLTPKEPPKIKSFKETPPPPPTTIIDVTKQPVIDKTPVNIDPVSVEDITGITGLEDGSGPATLSPMQWGNKDGDAVAISRIEPMYPAQAAQKGLEGWVKLSFDIDKTGAVTNVQVLEAQPKRVFNLAAVKALKRWRYKAKLIEGLPVIQRNQVVVLEFNLD